MYCENCGQKLSDGARFCNKCGSPIDNEESVGEENENYEHSEKTNKDSTSVSDQNSSRVLTKNKANKHFPLWIKVVCGILILSVIVCGVILAINLFQNNQPATNGNTLSTEDNSIDDSHDPSKGDKEESSQTETVTEVSERPAKVLSTDDYIEIYSQGSFYHERFKEDSDYSFPLLKVSSDDANAFNDEMKAVYDDFLEKLSSGQSVDFMDMPLGVSYEANINDNILSLCITRNNGLNNYTFFVINLDVDTSEKLSNNDILDYLGVTFDRIREDIRSSLKTAYMNEYGSAYDQMDSNTKDYCDKSFSDDSIEKVSLYLSSNKDLYGAFPINYMYQSGWNELSVKINY